MVGACSTQTEVKGGLAEMKASQVEMVEDSDRDIYDETKSSWELGKSLGLYAENDNLVIETLIGVLKSKSDHLM